MISLLAFDKIQSPFLIKSSLQTRIERELPQLDKQNVLAFYDCDKTPEINQLIRRKILFWS
jgi:hypothetical protein